MIVLKQRAFITMATCTMLIYFVVPMRAIADPPNRLKFANEMSGPKPPKPAHEAPGLKLPNFSNESPSVNVSAVKSFSGEDNGLTNGPIESAIQSTKRAYSLDIIDQVMVAGSDSGSSDFMTNHLPDLGIAVQQNLTEFVGVENAAAMAIDLSQLQLATDASVRVYFLTEGAGYHNALGFTTEDSGIDDGEPKLIFPDASTSVSLLHPDMSLPSVTSQAPLLPGDFVDLGSMAGGVQLDFFLIANGMTGAPVYSTDIAANPDGIQHVVTLALEDSPFLIMGFEDLWGGGDRDYNDLVIAIYIGEENVAHMSAAPEPSTAIMFALFLGVAWFKEEDEVVEDIA